jgi:hypothetical protein
MSRRPCDRGSATGWRRSWQPPCLSTSPAR